MDQLIAPIALYPRQRLFVDRTMAKLRAGSSPLAIAACGFGKSVCIGALADALCGYGPVLVLVHREEIAGHLLNDISKVAPTRSITMVGGGSADWSGEVVIAMVQTASQNRMLAAMPAFAAVLIDEAHRADAPIYRKVMAACRARRPDVLVAGATATPNKADGRNYRGVFDTVADVVTVAELIASGKLVRPTTLAVDLGLADELRQLRQTTRGGAEVSMAAAERIMLPCNRAALEDWWDRIGHTGVQSIAFCTSIMAAEAAASILRGMGVTAAAVYAEMPAGEKRRIFAKYAAGRIQVLTNAHLLAEGFDHKPIGCVILLRPTSHASTLGQMIGRGLRPYPGKTSCMVLDYGLSSLTLGTIEAQADALRLTRAGDALTLSFSGEEIACPHCGFRNPIELDACPICLKPLRPEPVEDEPEDEDAEPWVDGAPDDDEQHEGGTAIISAPRLDSVAVRSVIEVDVIAGLTKRRWVDVGIREERAYVAEAGDVAAIVFRPRLDEWVAAAVHPSDRVEVIGSGSLPDAQRAADAFLNPRGDPVEASGDAPTWEQRLALPEHLRARFGEAVDARAARRAIKVRHLVHQALREWRRCQR